MTCLDAKAAFDLSPGDACDEYENLTYFLDELADGEGLNYFKMNGHVNPGDHFSQMMLSILISILDKLESEGLFQPSGWRAVFKPWNETGEFPDDFLHSAAASKNRTPSAPYSNEDVG